MNTTHKAPQADISLEDVEREAAQFTTSDDTPTDKSGQSDNTQFGIFQVKTAQQWIEEAKLRPIPKMLFDVFWFEGEICILFADTNLGKSILGVQIGNSISKGEAIQGFQLEANQQAVLYFDFELSGKQFEARYSKDYEQHYEFDDNFERAEIDTDVDMPESMDFEIFVHNSIEKIVKHSKIKILIIDNITYLGNQTEKAKNALPLMKMLKKLTKKYKLSMLILAHTPKRDLTKPITQNDLQGSKMIINFCDACFAIGKSHREDGVRYLKQIKVRSSEEVYSENNVAVCQIEKPDNFLQFRHLDFGTEYEHLKRMSESDKQKLDDRIIEMKENHSDKSNREIARELNTNHNRVKRVWERHKKENS